MSNPPARATPYSWYVLSVLFLVYVVNYVDRQIISILAEDIKRDLELRDEELGFLYGTAFGVFYALFGVPLGRLADAWSRVRLMTVGLTLWSSMTTISGLAASGGQLAAARIGVGVGEASAAPSAYSLLSDWFPKHMRATALSIYSAGIFVGGGLALYLGGLIVQIWNQTYPVEAPFGLAGWQVAFMAVGLPGVFLAIWVSTLREPSRGAIEGLEAPPPHPAPFRAFGRDVMAIVPPFTILGAALQGRRALAVNLAGLAVVAGVVALLLAVGEPPAQWVTVGVGVYAVFSWGCSLKREDQATFAATIGSPAFLATILGYGLSAFVSTAAVFWGAPYAIRELGLPTTEAGLVLGAGGALAGLMGITLGGVLADSLRRFHPGGRLIVLALSAVLPAPFVFLGFTADSKWQFFGCLIAVQFMASSGLGAAAATTQDLVLPRMRGTATAIFLVCTTLMGFALGPYLAGRISSLTGSLSIGMLSLLPASAFAVTAAVAAFRLVPQAERQREQALAVGNADVI